MKKLKLIKLNQNSDLSNEAMNQIKGGASCCCGCCYSGQPGGSSIDSNYNANYGSSSSCSCGNTTYGALY